MSVGKSSISRAGKVAEKVIGNPDEQLKFFVEPSATPSVTPDEVRLDFVAPDDILPSYDESMITCAATFDGVVESVKKYGILIPMLLRRIDSEEGAKYRIIMGHKRFYAAKKLGLTKIPAEIIVCDDKTAALIFNEAVRYDSVSKKLDDAPVRKKPVDTGDDELPSYLL